MNPEIAQKINELKNDRLNGANWLSAQALNLLGFTIKTSQANTTTDFLDELKMTASAIAEARPNMISIENYACQFLNHIIDIAQNQKNLDFVKSAAQARVNKLIKFIKEATQRAAEHGAEMVNDQDTIITCSYSSTVCNTFKIARERAIKFKVIIAESRHKDNVYGEISAQQLKHYDISTRVIHDKEINRYAYESNKALVGTDTILSNGSTINGTPSYKLAQAASLAAIPFYSIGETAKIDIRNYHGKQSPLEPGFELIPAGLITAFITETGMIKSRDIPKYISRYSENC